MTSTMPPREMTGDRPLGLRLVVYVPGRAVESRFLDRGALDIGREPSNGLYLDDPRASKLHARLRRRRDTGEFEIADEGSRNGTFVDGARLQQALLSDNAVLRWGDTLAVAELGPDLGRSDDPARAHASILLEEDIARAAAGAGAALILGPPGCGKSWIAARIAERSARRGPFVAVNCAAIPSDLVESELFGHVRGAFTGAAADKPGIIPSAAGGTVFLDEIGATSPAFQAKLLTCIEERTVRPVGATRSHPVDVRFLAATNLDVACALADGTFREDLCWRLSEITLHVQPLARRRADLMGLLGAEAGLADHRDLTPEALEALLLHDWPGNVRELLQVAKRLATAPRPIDYHHLPAALVERIRHRPATQPMPSPRGAPSRESLAAELEAAGGNVAELARRLGQHRTQVVRWLKAYGLWKRQS